jgi:hypothetical protein
MLLLSKVGTGLPFENGHCEKGSKYNGDMDERLGIGFFLWYWILDEMNTVPNSIEI